MLFPFNPKNCWPLPVDAGGRSSSEEEWHCKVSFIGSFSFRLRLLVLRLYIVFLLLNLKALSAMGHILFIDQYIHTFRLKTKNTTHNNP
ncbi:hypothetical protein MANES_02G133250v8 [Manihot esculenta]|uniref:Uncharacterized protein n=1 Tax=Manihot esculenta TaxID=3983 RepID=A0ACB7I7N2_MANES|nr:hypothetical protein MANES_02G133250v8 [Manihot esculenta]